MGSAEQHALEVDAIFIVEEYKYNTSLGDNQLQ